MERDMICVDCRNMWAGPSGVIGYQRTLARLLPAIAPRSHFQLLLPGEEADDLDPLPNVHAVYTPVDAAGALASLSMPKRIDLRGLTLIHATGGVFPDARIPVVTTIHDTRWITCPECVCPPGLISRLVCTVYRRLLLRALKLSSLIIVPSQTTWREIDQIAPEAADRVRVVPNGTGQEFTPLNSSDPGEVRGVCDTRDRLVPGARRYVMEVGRPSDHRNHVGLLRAFAQVFRRDSTMHLLFVQPLDARTRRLTRAVTELGIEGRVHFISGVSNQELCRLYQGAFCLCHPTSYESYPTPVVEAMACGCPVITSGRAAAGEIAQGAAQLVNPEREDEIEAALQRLVREPGAADRLRARGLVRSRDLTPAATARATWKVYEEALAASA
jgi:glycosyltransferase involved in cell wall biosynthesis